MVPAQIGRYEITGELGRGAMGVVYKARDPLINRVVAVKSVALDGSDGDAQAFEKRFYREAQSAGRLNHFNIVTIHDVGRSGDFAYIAMEFLEGRSLREIIDSGVVLAPQRCAEIAAQVADGLAFAHARQVVHRDIKPANIMVLDDGGGVKITDFGIALHPTGSRNTASGKVFGSPKYISPEHLSGGVVDGRSDVFSLGAVLYEMLTGIAPFGGADLSMLLDQVMYVMPAPPSSRNRKIPSTYDRVVAMALAKDPDRRYANAADFAADLRALRDGKDPAIATGGARREPPRQSLRAVGDATMPFIPPALAIGRDDDEVRVVDLAQTTSVRGLPPWVLWGAPLLLVAILAAWVMLPRHRSATTPPAELPLPAAPAADSGPAPSAPATAGPSGKSESPSTTTASARDTLTTPALPDSVEPRVLNRETRVLPPAPVARAPVALAPAAKERQAVPEAVGRLTFAVAPWGEIFVDGKSRGVSPPLTELKLPPGRHAIEIRNATLAPHAETVDLKPDETLKIRHKFQ